MKSFNLTIPEELLDYVHRRTREGGFGTPTEFLRHLIRKDREDRAADENLGVQLVRALKSRSGEGDVSDIFKKLQKRGSRAEPRDRRRANAEGLR